MSKRLKKRIILAVLALCFLFFIWHKPKTTITCTDGDGKAVILEPHRLDSLHKASWDKYGK